MGGDTRGAPVWHTDEPIDRLVRLCDEWPRVCIGSSSHHQIGAMNWHQVMNEAFNRLAKFSRMPWTHGLRMQSVGHLFPFGSVDSADIARNNNRKQNTVRSMCDRWDCVQPLPWTPQPEQVELI
jgi:hypothetical protein